VLCPLLWVTLLGQGAGGWGVPQRSLPTPPCWVLWFCRSTSSSRSLAVWQLMHAARRRKAPVQLGPGGFPKARGQNPPEVPRRWRHGRCPRARGPRALCLGLPGRGRGEGFIFSRGYLWIRKTNAFGVGSAASRRGRERGRELRRRKRPSQETPPA